jgi:histidinol dehydrogenase
MVEVIEYPSAPAEIRLSHIATRKMGADPLLEKQVLEILETVRHGGDSALVDYTRQFDAPAFDAKQLTVPQDEIDAAYKKVDADFLPILQAAIANIETFHRHQLRTSTFITRPDGTFLGQMVTPVSSAGLYIPGGRAGETPLISSVLMNGIPARLAGVKDIALATPPQRDGALNPYLLVAAREVGVSRIHTIGSAWAIAALAYGTASVAKTDVIVGPGNIFVALAKKLVAGEVGIDMLAGPSEILVIADHQANPDYLAADLLSQAEHDAMASSVLITTDRGVAEQTLQSLGRQLLQLPRAEIARKSLENYGAFFLVSDLDAAIELANRVAPEHLELQIQDPWAHLGKITHAGAVFLGEYTSEAVGDYFAGPNHVLPTAGAARFASALGVDNFLKRTSVIAYSRSALERDADAILRLAELEGLEAHAASIRVRTGRESFQKSTPN